MGATLHYLYVHTGALTALRAEGGGLRVTGHFERPASHAADDSHESPEWTADFAALLRTHRHDHYVWMVDTVDEELALEQIPRVRGRDLRKIVARRLEQRFRGKPLATWLPAVAAARRGWRAWLPAGGETQPVVLTALGTEQVMQPWLAAARQARVAIEGIHSPALLARALARRIVPHPTGLLVSLHPAGLRQTLLLEGRARFTRLAAIGVTPTIDAVRLECERALQYLLMTQMVSRHSITSPDFRLWLAADGLEGLSRMPSALQIDNGTHVSVGLLDATAFGSPPVRGDGPPLRALPMWLQPPLWQARRDGYATGAILQQARIALRRRWMLGASSAALLVALTGNAGVELIDRFGGEDARLLTQLRSGRLERDRLHQQVAGEPVAGAEMRRIVELDAKLRERTVDARALLDRIARALAPDDSLQLRRVQLSRGPLPDSDDPAGGGPPAGTASASLAPAASVPFGRAPVAVTPVATATPPTSPISTNDDTARAHARIVGEFTEAPAMLEANRRVESFARRLAAQCGCEATVRRLPYDPQPTQAYNGGRPSGTRERVAFEVDLRWNAGAAARGGIFPGERDAPKS